VQHLEEPHPFGDDPEQLIRLRADEQHFRQPRRVRTPAQIGRKDLRPQRRFIDAQRPRRAQGVAAHGAAALDEKDAPVHGA